MDVIPVNYELTFEPDLKKFIFNGTESITAICKKTTNIISMNCAEIKIKSCNVVWKGENYSFFCKTRCKKGRTTNKIK